MSKFLQQQPLILASGSRIRAELLQSLGLTFEIIPSHCQEERIKNANRNADRVDLGYALAQDKALSVNEQFPEHYVLGADQLCLFENTIFDKPQNHHTALKQLSLLNGKKHQQLVCMCIAHKTKIVWQHHELAELTMRLLPTSVIENYLLDEQPYQSCGAYHFESGGRWLFAKIKGEDDTILGLPRQPLMAAFLHLNIVYFNSTGSSADDGNC